MPASVLRVTNVPGRHCFLCVRTVPMTGLASLRAGLWRIGPARTNSASCSNPAICSHEEELMSNVEVNRTAGSYSLATADHQERSARSTIRNSTGPRPPSSFRLSCSSSAVPLAVYLQLEPIGQRRLHHCRHRCKRLRIDGLPRVDVVAIGTEPGRATANVGAGHAVRVFDEEHEGSAGDDARARSARRDRDRRGYQVVWV